MGLDPWLFDSSPRINRQEATTHQGMVAVDGATVVQKMATPSVITGQPVGRGVSASRTCPRPTPARRLPPTTHSVEATIAEGFGQLLTLTSSPGSFSFYCAPNFAVMVRRHKADASSSIYLHSANFSFSSGHSGEWVDEGFDSLCSNTKVNNGYLCMIPIGGGGAAVAWIDPVTGTSNMLGQAKANGNPDGHDPWPDSPCPLLAPEAFRTFDDTKSVPTWYCLAQSGKTQIVLQVTYTGTYDSSRPFADTDPIGAGNPRGHDNYSITYSNAVITNLTPASRQRPEESAYGFRALLRPDDGLQYRPGPARQPARFTVIAPKIRWAGSRSSVRAMETPLMPASRAAPTSSRP